MKKIFFTGILIILLTSCSGYKSLYSGKLSYDVISATPEDLNKKNKINVYDGIIKINNFYYKAKLNNKLKIISIERIITNINK